MVRAAPASISCDFDGPPESACSVPSTPSPGARCAMSLQNMRRTTVTSSSSCKAPPPLAHDCDDNAPHDHIDVPSTPSPLGDHGGSLATFRQEAQQFQMSTLASCLLPPPLPVPQDCYDSLNQYLVPCDYSDSNCAELNAVLHYLAPADATSTTSAAPMDFQRWSPQPVPPPPVLPPQLSNYSNRAFVEPPPAPAPYADDCCPAALAASAAGAYVRQSVSGEVSCSQFDMASKMQHNGVLHGNMYCEGPSANTPSVSNAAWTRPNGHALPKQLDAWQTHQASSFNDHAGFAFQASRSNAMHTGHPFQCDNALGAPTPQKRGSQAPFLQLEHMLAFDDSTAASETPSPAEDAASDAPPQLGSAELPSIGSLGHYMRRCKPCAFVTKMGCANGTQCVFCHLCQPGEKKRRRKEKKSIVSAARKLGSMHPPRDDRALRTKPLTYA